jgi:hypothetical protein
MVEEEDAAGVGFGKITPRTAGDSMLALQFPTVSGGNAQWGELILGVSFVLTPVVDHGALENKLSSPGFSWIQPNS